MFDYSWNVWIIYEELQWEGPRRCDTCHKMWQVLCTHPWWWVHWWVQIWNKGQNHENVACDIPNETVGRCLSYKLEIIVVIWWLVEILVFFTLFLCTKFTAKIPIFKQLVYLHFYIKSLDISHIHRQVSRQRIH